VEKVIFLAKGQNEGRMKKTGGREGGEEEEPGILKFKPFDWSGEKIDWPWPPGHPPVPIFPFGIFPFRSAML
jgi:hypothetical protein